jgi:hypothetical protein
VSAGVLTVRKNLAKKPSFASRRPRGSLEKTDREEDAVHPRVRQIDLPPRLPAGCSRGRYGAGGQPVVLPKAAAVQRQEPYARARRKKPSGRSRPKARGEEGKEERGDRHIIAAPTARWQPPLLFGHSLCVSSCQVLDRRRRAASRARGARDAHEGRSRASAPRGRRRRSHGALGRWQEASTAFRAQSLLTVLSFEPKAQA